MILMHQVYNLIQLNVMGVFMVYLCHRCDVGGAKSKIFFFSPTEWQRKSFSSEEVRRRKSAISISASTTRTSKNGLDENLVFILEQFGEIKEREKNRESEGKNKDESKFNKDMNKLRISNGLFKG